MEYCIINSHLLNEIELWFGPVQPCDVIIPLDPQWTTMAHIMYHVGIFKSIGEGRRNGWDKAIPLGFTDLKVGKLRTRITIVNIPN